MEASPTPTVARLARARRMEKEQTHFYRSLAAAAEAAGDAVASERLNELHADEQHHLSRLTARILELGGEPEALPSPPVEEVISGWEARARSREALEIAFYETLLAEEVLDPGSRAVVEEILASEAQHRTHLGGKWMSA
ncbi:MAG: hypothetical protein RQ751_12860 [Longimicrobiales bacterium]|nr:hypothetical protein [Longimicrobiales bacterium]